MRIGFNLPQMGPLAHQPRDAARYAREAEALGADSLWVYDRLLAPVNPTIGYNGAETFPPEFNAILDPFALLTVAAIMLMLSVLFRSSAASIGTMLASLIGGTILTRVSPEWTAGKYLFVSALTLSDYYTGEPTPYEGMTMAFCMTLLAAWAVGALVIAFTQYTRRDVFG